MIELKPGTKFEDLELETKYKFELDGRISPRGIKRVRNTIDVYSDIREKRTRWRLDINRSIGGPVWMTDKGSFPKRVASYMYKTYNVKLSSQVIRSIGNTAQQNSTQGELIFDFARQIVWSAGTFGDEGSCFWTDYDGARIAMMRAGIGAIRIYGHRLGPRLAGTGRAWFFPHEGHFVLFNAYGPLQARSMANFLSQLFGDYKYKPVHIGHTRYDPITKRYNGTYQLYLNSDGYIIHNKPFKKRLHFPVLDGNRPTEGTNTWGKNNLPGEGDKWFDKE